MSHRSTRSERATKGTRDPRLGLNPRMDASLSKREQLGANNPAELPAGARARDCDCKQPCSFFRAHLGRRKKRRESREPDACVLVERSHVFTATFPLRPLQLACQAPQDQEKFRCPGFVLPFWFVLVWLSARGENSSLSSNEVPGVENHRLRTWLTYCATGKTVSPRAGLSLPSAGESLPCPARPRSRFNFIAQRLAH